MDLRNLTKSIITSVLIYSLINKMYTLTTTIKLTLQIVATIWTKTTTKVEDKMIITINMLLLVNIKKIGNYNCCNYGVCHDYFVFDDNNHQFTNAFNNPHHFDVKILLSRVRHCCCKI